MLEAGAVRNAEIRTGRALEIYDSETPITSDQFLPRVGSGLRHSGIDPRAVHLWTFDVDSLSASARQTVRSFLSMDEIDRARRFRFALDRSRFEIGRGAIRKILSHYTGRRPPDIRFQRGAFGKPFLQDLGIYVNWSHSGSWWSLAVSAAGRIGVDIELEENAADWTGPASIAFSTHEIGYVIHEQDPERRKRHFIGVWTRKEALVKATGKGLHDAMTALSVVDPQGRPKSKVDLGADGCCWLSPFRGGPSVVGAVATAFLATDIRYCDGKALVEAPVDSNPRSLSHKNCLASVRAELLP
ncbi:4'-phosphopantetheinyl transferase family protein [Neorhizobium sp. DT-125]|uniref:4'-phosphopantetheinyl transferase family protein n=1 Tax=Neorhizobium sp. DT-125 TaxID=3396163 RepID=UPI003F199FB7